MSQEPPRRRLCTFFGYLLTTRALYLLLTTRVDVFAVFFSGDRSVFFFMVRLLFHVPLHFTGRKELAR